MLDNGSVTALDADTGNTMLVQQSGDLAQPGSRVRDGDCLDAASLIVDDAEGVVLPGPVDPGVSGRSLHE
jgi:hypothetical protein